MTIVSNDENAQRLSYIKSKIKKGDKSLLNLNLKNNLSNSKENNFVQKFIKELSDFLKGDNLNKEVSDTNLNNINMEINDSKWNDILEDDLTLYDNKIISKFKNEMLIERVNILQNYSESTKEKGEMFYIYSVNEENSYNLCNCKNNQVITKNIEELQAGSNLGSVLRKVGTNFTLDKEATKIVNEKINTMIKEKINEQNEYLSKCRVDGHRYEVSEKYAGRIVLYDLDNKKNGGFEAIEEINFPKDLYESVKPGDVVMYKDGKYIK